MTMNDELIKYMREPSQNVQDSNLRPSHYFGKSGDKEKMEYSVERLEQEVIIFYHSTDGATQGQSHHFLTGAQISPQAWSFSWSLLDPQKPPEVQFFGANTLHVKVSKYWHEVPADHYSLLKNKLLESIFAYSAGPKIILNKLCIALSAYILHTVPEHWADPFADLITIFEPSNHPKMPLQNLLCTYLEILTLIPEEFQSMHIAQSQRGVVRNELQKNAPRILSALQELLGCPEACLEMSQQAIKCAGSWMQFGVPLPDAEPLAGCLQVAVTIPDLTDPSVEALSLMLTHPDSHKYPTTLLRILAQLLRLREMIERGAEDGMDDSVASICTLFIALAESHSRLLLDTLLLDGEPRNNVLQLIEIILRCSNTPGQYPTEENCSELAFGFWYILQDDIIASDPDKFQIYEDLLSPVYRSLVDVLLLKSMYSPEEGDWSVDEKEQFRCYRQDVSDTLMYCYNILRECMLELLDARLVSAVIKFRENSSHWQPLESCLHAYYAVAENIEIEENFYIPKFISMLQEIPFNSNIRVIATALDAIGVYAEWINAHPEVLNYVVPLLVMGLESPDVAPSATMALKDITRDCQSSMKPFAEHILHGSREALIRQNLKISEYVRLMYTVGKVLSVLPMEIIMNHLNALLMPYVEELRKIVLQEPSPFIKAVILLRLKMISMLFATLDTKPQDEVYDVSEGSESGFSCQQQSHQRSQVITEPQPVFLVLQEIMPIIQGVMDKWYRDGHVIEAVFSVLKQASATLLDESKPLVPDILQLLMKSYKLHPHGAALDLARQFLILFGKEDSQVVIMRSLLSEICLVTLGTCEPNMSEQADILEAFFLLLSQILKKNSQMFNSDTINVTALFHCATVTLGLPEAGAVKAAASFLGTFITESRDIPCLLLVVNNSGEALVERILRCIGGESPRSVMEHMADVLHALNKKYFDNLCRWLNQFLSQDGFPSQRITKEQAEHFKKMVLKERGNKRKLQETVREFTLMCRGLIGTEYASQVPLLF